jgi:hypothetical protein
MLQVASYATIFRLAKCKLAQFSQLSKTIPIIVNFAIWH